MEKSVEVQPLEIQQNGVRMIADVFRSGFRHAESVAGMYLSGLLNVAGMTDNLRGVLDVWEAQYQGTLAQPGRQYVPHPVDYLAYVKQFHHTFQSPVLDAPQIPAADRCALRINLLSEELEELVAAIEARDLVAIADALCDLQYVLSGAVLEFGLTDKFGALFCEVHRSNMSKACLTEEEAKATVELFAKKGETSTYKEVDGMYLVFRTVDRKTLKSINYSPADLESILVTATTDQS